jgi:hypothetical protein
MISVRVAHYLLALSAAIAVAPAFAGAEEAAERGARLLAEAPVRTFKKAVEVCASQEEPDAKSIELLFDRYLSALYSGAKAGLLEMYKVENASYQSELYGPKEIEIQLRQGEQNAQAMRESPAACKKLVEHLTSGSAAAFKQFVIDSHREYLEKRRAYCSRSPKPTNCD